jgi:hypothetical protein
MSDNAVSKGKNMANFIPEVWSTKLSAVLDKSGVMMQCVNRNYEGEISKSCDTVKIRTLGDVTIHTYSGTIASYDTLTDPVQTMIIDQQKAFYFKIDDIDKVQSNIDVTNGYIDRAKDAIDLVKDTFLLGKHVDVPSANIVGFETEPIILKKDAIYSNFVELSKRLKKANALSNGQKPWVVINPDIEAILIQAPEFIHATQLGDKTLREGSIGRIAGLDVLVCTNLEATTVDTSDFDGDLFHVLAGTNDAITFASQVVEVEKLRDQNSFSNLIRGLYVYGAQTVVPNAMAKLICTLTTYTPS